VEKPDAESELEAALEMSPLALTGNDCSFAGEGSGGAYAQTLCWLDYEGFSTQYAYVDRSAAVASCSSVIGVVTCHATAEFQSVMGPQYGTQQATATGTATFGLENRARERALEAVQYNPNSSSTFHSNGNGGPFFGPVSNVDVDVNLGDGYRLVGKIDVNWTGNSNAARIAAESFPTYDGAFLGNRGFYTGVSGQPVLRSVGQKGGQSTITLKNIQLLNAAGNAERDFSIVVADAESTDASERIDWSTTGEGFRWLPNTPNPSPPASKTQVMGNACTNSSTSGLSPAWNSTTPSQNAHCSANVSSNKTGTPMLSTAPPANQSTQFQVTQSMTTNERQGVAFGVIMARAETSVEVVDRIVDENNTPAGGANFTTSVQRADGATVTSASTGTAVGANAKSSARVLPINATTPTQLHYTSKATGTHAGSYSPTWTCRKNDPVRGEERWPGNGSPTPPGSNDSFTRLTAGQFLSCKVTYTPPYLELSKAVDPETAPDAPSAWTLEATGDGAAPSSVSGVAASEEVTKRPVATGTYELTESGPDSPEWEYGYSWTNFSCEALSGSAALPASDVRVPRDSDDNVADAVGVKISQGQNLRCTYTNTANEPQLQVSKSADPSSGETLDAGQTVTYTLNFDNADGSAAKEIDYVDHLRDVLDDAEYGGNLRYGQSAPTVIPPGPQPGDIGISVEEQEIEQPGNSDPDWKSWNPRLHITGEVPARTAWTLQFDVTVKPNEANRAQRLEQDPPYAGYRLRNFLTPASDDDGNPISAPSSCEAADDEQSGCTEHPVDAWTIEKTSQPQDGAMIHSGGNIYYRVKVTNFGGTDLTGVQVHDNMTQSLSAATLDFSAPPAVTVPWGISYYAADGTHLHTAQTWKGVNGSGQPTLTFVPDGATVNGETCDLSAEFFADELDEVPSSAAGCWNFATPEFDVPAQYEGQEVAYAVVGYVVKGGQAAAAAQPGNSDTNAGSTASKEPTQPNATWVNTASAAARNTGNDEISARPVFCSASDDIPPGWQDTEDYLTNWAPCKVFHSLGDSYFHIWKKDATNAPGNETNNNLADASFVLADTEQEARQGSASRWLCRIDNAPLNEYPNPTSAAALDWTPTGAEIVGSQTGNANAAWDYESTQGGVHWWLKQSNTARETWNLRNPDATPKEILPECGAFFAVEGDVPQEGQAVGSWRALDLRGGDTSDLSDPASAPKSDWRNTSDFNVSGDESTGRHGTYWLVETRSPEKFELLSQPMRLWVAPSSPAPTNLTPGNPELYEYQGRLSQPVLGQTATPPTSGGMGVPGDSSVALRKHCVNPWQLPADGQVSCVMPTGWAMPVFDVKLPALPLTGGDKLGLLIGGGIAVLLAALAGGLWWRKRRD